MNVKKRIVSSIVVILIMAFTSLQAQEVQGSWKGTLSVQGAEVPLVFNVSKEDGKYSTTMDSPSQGATDIPMDETIFENNQLSISFKKAGIKYVGTLKDATLTGTFSQGGQEFPLSLEKTEKTIPGDTALPTSDISLEKLAGLDDLNYKYSVEDYFAKPKARSFQFSPNGTYMSYREKDDNGKNHVYVKNLTSDKVTRVIEEKEELIRGYGWANDSRLVYIMDKGGNENYHLFAANIDGSAQKELTPFDGVRVNILELLKEDKDHMIISMNKNNAQIFEPYKVNIVTGALTQLYKNEDAANPIMGYNFDKDGKLRGFSKLRDGVNIDMYYAKEEGNYQLLKALNWKDTFTIASFNYASSNPHDAYVVSNLESHCPRKQIL